MYICAYEEYNYILLLLNSVYIININIFLIIFLYIYIIEKSKEIEKQLLDEIQDYKQQVLICSIVTY